MRAFLFLAMCVASITSVIAETPVHDGNLDISYGSFGMSFLPFPGNVPIAGGAITEPTLQPDGKLLLVSSKPQEPALRTDFGVIRLLTDGTIDTSFGTNGAAIASFDRSGSSDNDNASGMALQPADGKILVSGSIAGDASTGQDMAVVRFTSSGLLDVSFGTNGKAIVPFNLGNCPTVANACDDLAYRVDLQADGKILLVGLAASSQTATTSSNAMAIARLTTSGIRDSTFGGDGRVTLNFGSGDTALGFRARQLADGQHILAVGAANTTPGGTNLDFALARLDEHGNLDPSFGVGGQVTYGFDIGGDLTDVATDFAELPDGRLLVCGEVLANDPSNYDFACMRFLANGTPDSAFAPVLVPFDRGGTLADIPYAVRRDSQGRFLLAGADQRAAGNNDFAVARLTADGALDPSFGRNGIATFLSYSLFGTDYDNQATGLVIQPDDKIIVTGYAKVDASGNQQFQVLRLIGDTIFADNFESQ
jgi:uncharacterized delta-60 repeat protein